jgi:hypothetical protein
VNGIPETAFMRQNSFGKLWPVSALTLGGGGIGMVWGETTFDECVATVHAAIAAGINLIDLSLELRRWQSRTSRRRSLRGPPA